MSAAPREEPAALAAMGEAARRYARAGFAVFPCATAEGGRCSCGAERCPSPGKHPIGALVPHGVLDATTDERAVVEWWALYPDANVGIATGDASGVLVVDVDAGGFATVEHLEARHEPLAPTWAVETGSGGLHLFYRMPSADVRNSAGAIGPGVDVRANGGYVVAPPSRHASGQRYRWQAGWHPRTVALADVPPWLLDRMLPGGRAAAAPPLPGVLREGMRNTWLTSAAGSMRRRGFCQAAITAALRVENRARCRPALPEDEVDRIARSIARYEPAAGRATA